MVPQNTAEASEHGTRYLVAYAIRQCGSEVWSFCNSVTDLNPVRGTVFATTSRWITSRRSTVMPREPLLNGVRSDFWVWRLAGEYGP